MGITYKNLVEMQETSCSLFADRPIYGTKKKGQYHWVTYKEFGQLVNDFRGGLASLGVGPGDKVAVISANSLQWAVGAYATYGLRAHYVPMYETQSLEDWKYITRDSGAKVLLVSKKEILDKVKNLKNEIPGLKSIVLLDETASGPETYPDLLTIGKKNKVPSKHPDNQEPMGLIYTSGTTGNPKGVILSHENVLCNIRAVEACLDFKKEDVSLSFLPWAHIFGQVAEVHLLIAVGFSAAFAESVQTIVDDLALVKPTLLFSVPRIFNKIYDGVQAKMEKAPLPIRSLFHKGMELANKKRDEGHLSLLENIIYQLADKVVFKKIRARFGGRLRYALSGASALSPDVAKFIDNLNIAVYEGYGLSETAPMITVNYPGNRRIGTVGKVIPEVRVVLDKSVGSDGDEGEIIAYGPNVMLGYHNLPEETAKVMTPDGGFRTGDLGRFSKDGFLSITGRIKEQYKLENGKYVAPSHLEEKLKLSPFINQAFLYGDNKQYNVALLVVEVERVRQLAQQTGLSTEENTFLEDERLVQKIVEELEDFLREFKGYERPRKFKLLADDWSPETGILTPTLKLKRKLVIERYAHVIEALYS